MKIVSMVAEQYRNINPGYNPDNPPGGGPKVEAPMYDRLDRLQATVEQLRNELAEVKERLLMVAGPGNKI